MDAVYEGVEYARIVALALITSCAIAAAGAFLLTPVAEFLDHAARSD